MQTIDHNWAAKTGWSEFNSACYCGVTTKNHNIYIDLPFAHTAIRVYPFHAEILGVFPLQ